MLSITSPRARGEVGFRMKCESRVRGSHPARKVTVVCQDIEIPGLR